MAKGFLFSFKVILIPLLLFTISCTKEEEVGTTGNEPVPLVDPRVLEISGGVYDRVVGSGPIILTTEIIKNENQEVIADGHLMDISGTEAELTFAGLDSEEYELTKKIAAVGGRISFKVRYPNKTGTYRVQVRDPISNAVGRFFINLNAADVAALGAIKTNRYEDTPPFNGIKDPTELWSLQGDGVSSTYLVVGPITDAYGNQVSNSTINLTMDGGRIISENPTQISDGQAFFRIESDNAEKIVNVMVDAKNTEGTTLVSLSSQISFVRGRLSIEESGNLGQANLNETLQRTFVLRNQGTKDVTNITYSIDTPFSVNWSTSSCLGKTTLRIQEFCTLDVRFTSTARGNFQGNLKIIGSPVGVTGSSLSHPLSASSIVPTDLRISRPEIDFGEMNCGGIYQEEFFVQNLGDLDAVGFTVEQPPSYPGMSQTFYQIVVPPEDAVHSPDVEALLNCGNKFYAGRKCRVLVRFTPTALAPTRSLQGKIKYGTTELLVNVRGSSLVGPPTGSIPIQLTTNEERTAGSQFATDNLFLNLVGASESRAEVRIGPLKDLCGNSVNASAINLSVTKGSLDNTVVSAAGGIATANWVASSDILDLGTQTLTAIIRNPNNIVIASGSRSANFQGINLELEGVADLGQVLTKKSRVEFYTLRNRGNVSATGLVVSQSPANQPWFIVDNTYNGGCQSGILAAGASCRYRVVFNTDLSFSPSTNNVGDINVILGVSSPLRGVNSDSMSIIGRSELPPVINFSSTLYTLTSSPVIAGTPVQGTLILTNVGPGDTENVSVQVDSPFALDPLRTTCGTVIEGGTSCQIGVNLTQNTRGSYSGQVRVYSDFNLPAGYSAVTSVMAQVVSGPASGTIPIAFDRPSAPADKVTKVNITAGPILDAYGNVVNQGTEVEVASDRGILAGDADGDRIIILTTNSQGYVSTSIVSSDFSEIGNFSIAARVKNGSTILAQGVKAGAFSGAKLEFKETAVNFGTTVVGGVITQTINIRNKGNENITGVTVTSNVSGVFTSVNNPCSTITANGSCNVSWAFLPMEAQNYSATLTVRGTGNGVTEDTIAVSGRGVFPASLEIINPLSKSLNLTLIPGLNLTGSYQLKNTGNESLNNLTITAKNGNNQYSGFTFNKASNCNTLGADAECSVSFTFSPSAAVNGTLNLVVENEGVSDSRMTTDELNLQIVPLILTISRPQEQMSSDCGEIKVALRDGDNNLVPAPSLLSYNLSKVGPTGNFYSNSSCSGGTVSSISILGGNSESNSVYYKGSAGTHEIKVTKGSAFSYSANISILNSLSATSTYAKIVPGGTTTIQPSGGISPYSYSVVGGSSNGMINSSGVYTAPATTGTYSIQVQDSRPFPSPLSITLSVEVVPLNQTCSATNASNAQRTFQVASQQYGPCVITSCYSSFVLDTQGNVCVSESEFLIVEIQPRNPVVLGIVPRSGALKIDWGDGTGLVSYTGTSEISKTYGTTTVKTIKILGNFNKRTSSSPLFPKTSTTGALLKDIKNWGTSLYPVSLENFFLQETEFLSISALGSPNLSQVTNLTGLFNGAENFNSSVNFLNTATVTQMGSLFRGAALFNNGCDAVQTNCPLNLQTGNVLGMSSMFEGATQFNQELNFNTSKVTSMANMFMGAINFDQEINFDTSKVTDVGSMFSGATNYNQDLSFLCFPLIALEPTSFYFNTPNWVLPRPLFGAACVP